MQKQTIAITATFTAEPIEESLALWMQELGFPSRIEFAPYNQVFQQLLDPSSILSKNRDGINVILVRFEDWLNSEDGGGTTIDSSSGARQKIERDVRDFIRALKSAAGRSAAPYLICLCPASSAALADSNLAACFKGMEELMASELGNAGGIYLVTAADVAASYPVAGYEDSHGDKLGRVPYTQAFFAALGTKIARKIYRLRTPSHKVIALDCDQTMWRGVCGEDGPHGIEIDSPRRRLQEFMRAQHDKGMLICLCSKNNEEDVVKVFERRAEEMPIKREHIVDWRLNWGPKSENLKSLAGDLQLGLDSFIFVDDDPVACAEVRANCPEVLTLQLPQEVSSFSQFLNHIWDFDRLKVTGEDEKRTALYKQNAERERLRKESLSFGDFLADLNLEIRISEMRPEHLARVSQLTHRTNQFNFTTVRRSEGEIQALCQAGETECLVVEVSDRFGDYGLVGVIIFRAESEAVDMDTFLLSCRALGRGVEHRMLAKLGEIAKERSLDYVDVKFIASGKNRPAHDFLNNVGANFKQPIDGGYSYRFPTEFAGATVYRPTSAEPIVADDSTDKPPTLFIPAVLDEGGRETKSALMSRIAAELCTVEQILKAVEDKKRRTRPQLAGTYVAPRTPTEEILAGIWAQSFGIDRVGVNDDFFQLGGHSLLGTLLMSRVCTTFQIELSLGELFAAPTVVGLARIVQQGQIEQAGAQEIDAALKELGELTDEEVTALLAADEEADQEADGAYPVNQDASEKVRR